nr:hypothetical protein [Fusobacterium gastrosuis]
MNDIVMSIETTKIKEFIFSTNKLKVIRGASYLLDYLNQIEVHKILKNNSVKDENIIYIAAGNAKFFVKDEQTAKKISKEVKDIYRKWAPSAKIVTVFKEKEENEKIWDTLDKLAEMVAEEKNKGYQILNIDLPFMEKCELSGNQPAEIFKGDSESINILKGDMERLGILKDIESLDLENKELSSIICGTKDILDKLAPKTGKVSEETIRKIIFSTFIKEGMENKQNYNEQPISFYSEVKDILKIKTNIEDFENENSFIGFMYSDGDGLGDFLKKVSNKYKEKTEDEYIKFLKNFSKELDKNTKESMKETLKVIFKPCEKSNNKEAMGEFIIVGGDDVCAVFNADKVLEISAEFQKIFEEKMYKYTKAEIGDDIRITSSSGIIIAKSKTPMFHLFERALELQKSAKLKRYECREDENNLAKTGFIDFQVIGSEGCVNIKEFRKQINKNDNKVMERPYAINMEEKDAGNNMAVKNISTLLEQVRKLKETDFSKSKIRYIYDLKRKENLEDFEKLMEFINIISKMSSNELKIVKEWEQNFDSENKKFADLFTNIFDVLEMYDFIN